MAYLTYTEKFCPCFSVMFLKTSGKLGRRFFSSPTYVYDHCFSPKYCNFLKNALPPELAISNSILRISGRVNFLIYRSELYSSPAYKRIKTAQFNMLYKTIDVLDLVFSFILITNPTPHSFSSSSLLIYCYLYSEYSSLPDFDISLCILS